MELRGPFAEALEELRREFERFVAGLEKGKDEDGNEWEPVEILEEVIADGVPGLREFVDALDRAGWDLVRRSRLPAAKTSGKLRKPRIKRIAVE
jgi:hypothetical protein